MGDEIINSFPILFHIITIVLFLVCNKLLINFILFNLVMDETTAKGMPPQLVASRVVEAVACDEAEVVLSSITHKAAIILRTISPNIYFWLMSRRAKTSS